MKRQIRNQNFIVWFNDGEDEDYTIIPAKNIAEARDQAEEMFGEDIISVQFYNP